MQTQTLKTRCDRCGAPFPVHPAGHTGAAGYAELRDGSRICYPCADLSERDGMRTATAFVVYVGEKIVTTWTGGKLGAIVDSWKTTILGNEGVAYQIVDIHGNRWHGRHGGYFAGKGCALRIRRCKRR